MEFYSPVRQRYRRSPPMSDSEDVQIPFSFSPKSLSQRRQRKFALLERLRRSTLLTTVGLAVLLLLLAGVLGSFIFLQYYSGGATIEPPSRPEMAPVHSYVMTRGPGASSAPSSSSEPDVAKTTQPALSHDLDSEGRQRRQLKAAMWNTARHRKLEKGMRLNRMGAAPVFENNGSRLDNGTFEGFNTSVPENARSSGSNSDGLKGIRPPVSYLNGSIEPSDQSYSSPSKNIDSNFSSTQAVNASDSQLNVTHFSNGVQSLEANFSHVNIQRNDSGVLSAGSPLVPALPAPLQSLSYARTHTGPLQSESITLLPDQVNQTGTQPSLGLDRQGERAEFTQHPVNQKHDESKPNALHHSSLQSPNIPLPQNQIPNEELKQLPHGVEQAPQQLASNMQQLNPQPQLQQQNRQQGLPQQLNHMSQQQHQHQQQHLNGLPQQHQQQLNYIPQQQQQNLRQEQLDQVPHRLPQQPSQQYQLPEQHLDQSTQERLNQILPLPHQTQLHAQDNDQVIRQQTDQTPQQLHQMPLQSQQQVLQGQNQVFQPLQQQRFHQVQNQMPQQVQNQMPQQVQNQMPQQVQNQMPQQVQNQMPQQVQNQMPQQVQNQMPQHVQNQMPQHVQNQMPQQVQNQMPQQVQNQMPQQVQNQMPQQVQNQMPQHFQPQLQHLFQNPIPVQHQQEQNHVQSLVPQGHQPQWYRTDHGHQSHHQSEQQPNQYPANYQQEEQFHQPHQQQQQQKLQQQFVNNQQQQESQVQFQNSQTAFSHQYSSFDTQQIPSHASQRLPLENDISSENGHLSAQNGLQSPQIKQNAEQLSFENIEQSSPQYVAHFSNGSSQQIPTSQAPQSNDQVLLPQFNQPYPLPHVQNTSAEKSSPLASSESIGASSNDVKQSATNTEDKLPKITDSSKPLVSDPVQNLANDSTNAASLGDLSKGSLSVPATNVEGPGIPSDVKITQDLDKRKSFRVENLTTEKSEQVPVKYAVSPEDVSKISRPFIARNISADQADPDISNYLHDSGNNSKRDTLALQAETSTSFTVAAESSSFIQASSDVQGTNGGSPTPTQENKRRHMKNSELPSVRLRRALQFEQDRHKANEDKAFPQKLNEVRSTGDASATPMSGEPVQNLQDNQKSAEAFPQQRVLLHVDENLKSIHTTEQLVSQGFGSPSQFAQYSPQVQHQNPQDQLQNSQVRYQAPQMQHQNPLMQTQYQMQDRNQIQQNLPKSFVSQGSSSEPRVFQQRQLLQYQLHDQYGQQNQNLQQHSQMFYNDFGPNVNKHPTAFYPSLQNGQGLTGKFDRPDNNAHSSHEWKDPNLIPVNQFNSMHPNGLFRIY